MTRRIIDSHHHVWLKNDLPWLSGPMLPRIFGPYGPIRRDYEMAEFRRDIAGTGVEKSVYVQANWAPARFEDEVAWVQGIADEAGWPHGIVGYADLMADDAGPQLEALSNYDLMRGIRMQLHWHENEMYRFAAHPDLMSEPVLRRNLGLLEGFGWSFDLQVFAGQMHSASVLAAEYPAITFVLQHSGMPEDTSPEGMDAWRAGMRMLAEQPNVVSKLSAFGTFIHRNDPAFIADISGETLAMFGSSRCLFGSNFPIEKLWTDYGSLVDAHLAAMSGYAEAEQDDVFWNTAARVYRLED